MLLNEGLAATVVEAKYFPVGIANDELRGSVAQTNAINAHTIRLGILLFRR